MIGWNFDMATAPRDGTLLQLLVERGDENSCDSFDDGFDDANPSRTFGFNNLDHDGVDRWLFPGWCWEHDHITEQGRGRPIAWAPMLALPESAP